MPVTENEMDGALLFLFYLKIEELRISDRLKLDPVLSSMTRVSLYSVCLSFSVVCFSCFFFYLLV